MKTLIRLHQLLLVIAILSGCYAPELRDCTVTCSAARDCAEGQVCGSDGYCAAAGTAGWCGGGADAAVDAAPMVALRIMIMGNGQVDVTGVGTCAMSDCTMMVPKNTRIVATAVARDSDKPFDKWTSLACAGQGARCELTPILATTTIAAKFR